MDLVLDNLQRLICHETQTTKPINITNFGFNEHVDLSELASDLAKEI